MQELIDNLISKAGLSPEQADKAIETVKDFIKEKFPMLEGAVENLLGKKSEGDNSAGGSDFLKNAESTIDNIKDKFGSFFSENK